MSQDIDYRTAFQFAPVGLVVSRHRVIVDCNEALAEMFRTSRELLIGQSFLVLYPSVEEFERTGERIAPVLNARGRYADDRIMKRADGELFWCHVTGRAMERSSPHAAGIWSFEDLSSRRPVQAELTGREREVAALLIEGQTSKHIGKALGISHRTVDVYRARLMRKFRASTTPELVQRLLGGTG
ncbi:PAS and helix-turn-helix domain-containing protein [Caldimonas thermodepolymerans]|nr:helix-turn-helix transcriptional regulator [Caldimonas thermodepolymerans]QPC33419.1 PAS and helix-turn-helix domain-containing protein [Caldimonas thermodepolymerans]